MQRRTFAISLIIFIMLPFTCLADQITLLSDPWCPFTCEPNSSKPGFMIEIAQNIFSKAGHTVKYSNLEWDKAVVETRKGNFNAVVGAFKEDAPDFVFPLESQGMAGNVFSVKKDSKWSYTDIKSLNKIKVGIIKGYSYGEKLDQLFKTKEKSGELIIVSGNEPLGTLIDGLMDGKIDTLIEDPAVLTDYLVESGMFDILGNIKTAGREGAPEAVYIAFSPANPKSKEFANILSKGMSELRKTGELVAILKKYEIKDWK